MAELKRRDVTWPVIVMTGHAEVKMAVSVMKQGAIEFMEKPFEEDQLREARAKALARRATSTLSVTTTSSSPVMTRTSPFLRSLM